MTRFSITDLKFDSIVLRSSYRDSNPNNSTASHWSSAAYQWSQDPRGFCGMNVNSNSCDIRIDLLDASLNEVHSYNFYRCLPVNWKFDGVEEELTLQCDFMRLSNFDTGTMGISLWLDSILETYEQNRSYLDPGFSPADTLPRDIAVAVVAGKLNLNSNYINVIPTRYTFPVLDVSATSSAATVAFSFRPNDFNVTQGSVTDAPQ